MYATGCVGIDCSYGVGRCGGSGGPDVTAAGDSGIYPGRDCFVSFGPERRFSSGYGPAGGDILAVFSRIGVAHCATEKNGPDGSNYRSGTDCVYQYLRLFYCQTFGF